MKSFNLNIENRIRVYFNTVSLFNYFCKALLVLPLDSHEISKHFFIIFIIKQFFKFIALGDKSVSDKICKILGKRFVCLTDPSSERDTVSYILKLIGSDSIEIVENCILEYLRMKRGNTVYGMGAGNTEICHSDNSA